MRNTEKKYWQNGIQKRGKDFYTIAGSLLNNLIITNYDYQKI